MGEAESVERPQQFERTGTSSGDRMTLANASLSDVSATRGGTTVPNGFPSVELNYTAGAGNRAEVQRVAYSAEQGGEGRQQETPRDWWARERDKQDDNIANGIKGLADKVAPGELLNPDSPLGRQLRKCLNGAHDFGGVAEMQRFINQVNQHLDGKYTLQMQRVDGRMEVRIQEGAAARGQDKPDTIRAVTVTDNQGARPRVIGSQLFVR